MKEIEVEICEERLASAGACGTDLVFLQLSGADPFISV